MSFFDLNNARGAVTGTGSARAYQNSGFQTSGFQASGFYSAAPPPVRSVKRLASHSWPFSVKSSVSRDAVQCHGLLQPASSFVT